MEEENWFKKYIDKYNELEETKNKYEKIIDNLVKCIAEDRGETEEEIREWFEIGE